jgi:hypothetical protein
MLQINRLTIVAAMAALCTAVPNAAQAVPAGGTTSTLVQDEDRRSPDAADPFMPTVDNRAPDNRVDQRTGVSLPAVAPIRVRVVEVRSNRFQWADAGVGAAGMLALVLVGVGAAMANAYRRGRRYTATTR